MNNFKYLVIQLRLSKISLLASLVLKKKISRSSNTTDLPTLYYRKSIFQYFDNKADKLELTVTSSDHLLIHHGKKQLVGFLCVKICKEI